MVSDLITINMEINVGPCCSSTAQCQAQQAPSGGTPCWAVLQRCDHINPKAHLAAGASAKLRLIA